MKKYYYEARDSATQKITKSVVQAESEVAAAKLLSAQGFVPLKIELQDEREGFFQRLSNKISSKDKIVFTRQLATLIGAGLPLAQSMHTVLEQTQNKQMQSIIQEIISDIESGRQLSSAFEKHPEVFDNVYVALVAAGEASGTLDEALKRIASQQEKDAAMLSKVRGAMVYPAIVLLVIIAVVVFMLVMVVPQVEGLYGSLHKELPFTTKAMVSVAGFLAQFWWALVILLGIGLYFFQQYLKTEAGIRAKDTFKLNIPVFDAMFRKLYMARFTRTGQTLLNSGVAMLDMLRITARAVNNSVIRQGIEHASEKVKGGKALSVSLKNEDYILPMVPQMIKIGEQSGKIDEMMGKCAQIYEDELDEEIKAITTTIEPVLMVVLAVVAGVMVGAIIFPIYNLVGDISL